MTASPPGRRPGTGCGCGGGMRRRTPISGICGRSWAQWSAQDALVLKWVVLLAEPLLPKPARCAHLKGHGGGRASLSEVRQALRSGEYAFVYRTDIKGKAITGIYASSRWLINCNGTWRIRCCAS